MSPCSEVWQMAGVRACEVKGPVGDVDVARPMHCCGSAGRHHGAPVQAREPHHVGLADLADVGRPQRAVGLHPRGQRWHGVSQREERSHDAKGALGQVGLADAGDAARVHVVQLGGGQNEGVRDQALCGRERLGGRDIAGRGRIGRHRKPALQREIQNGGDADSERCRSHDRCRGRPCRATATAKATTMTVGRCLLRGPNSFKTGNGDCGKVSAQAAEQAAEQAGHSRSWACVVTTGPR